MRIQILRTHSSYNFAIGFIPFELRQWGEGWYTVYISTIRIARWSISLRIEVGLPEQK